MSDIVQFSEEDLIRWLEPQLEKREFMNGYRFGSEQLKNEINEILFCEQRITVTDIEQFFIPFGQAGYLSPKCKFEIMLLTISLIHSKKHISPVH